MGNFNSWGVSFSTISFFERALKGHSKVAAVTRTRDIVFRIERVYPLSTVTALLVDEYALGLAAVLRAREEFPEADCIVTGSGWNGYTSEAKQFGNENKVGIFIINEFLGALNLNIPQKYVKKDEHGDAVYAIKDA